MINFRPPKKQFNSLVEEGKYKMLWNVSFLLMPIFVILVVIHILFKDPSVYTSLAGLGVSVFNLLYLKYYSNFKPISVLSVVLATIICQASIYIVNDSTEITDTLWVFLVSFFSFYMFNSIIGVFIMFGNMFLLMFDIYIHDGLDFKTIINVSYVTVAIAFIFHHMVKTAKDINRKLEEESEQKEVLIKEVHHRVKNNLQLISSLLRLQSSEINKKEVKEPFNDAVNRIKSIALVHEKMYQNEDLSAIDIKGYTEALIEDVLSSNAQNIQLNTTVTSDIKRIKVKNIVPLGLLFNELIVNSIKHAFHDKITGKISISISVENEFVKIIYADNGNWVSPEKEDSFGLELIDTLCEQLEGSFTRENSSGTTYSFLFRIDEENEIDTSTE